MGGGGQYSHYKQSDKTDSLTHPPIVISLTSFPARISYIHHTLYSIFMQDYPYFSIALFLSVDEFPHKKLPYILRIFATLNLIKIHFVEGNLRAYKKLFYALRIYSKHIIITIDDDQMYDSQTISLLINSYKKYPHCIHTHWAYDSDFIMEVLDIPKAYYMKIIKENQPHLALINVGVSGVLYPPHSFNNEFFNIDNILSLCPHNDDLWFFVMSVLNDTKKVLVINSLEHPKESAIAIFESPNLWEINVVQNRNYDQLSALLSAYPQTKEKILHSLKAKQDIKESSNIK